MTRSALSAVATVTAIVLTAAACRGPGEDVAASPSDAALLPDLVPAAPVDIHTLNEDGVDVLRFTSTLVNVGEGDFVLRGEREGPQTDDWSVYQEVSRSGGESTVVPTDATMAWGGDRHGHWHVARVAEYHLVPLDADGEVVEGVEPMVDTKVGFCFFDSGKQLEDVGPNEAVYSHKTCGSEAATEFNVGLSVGWGDIYSWVLPGQSFEITDLADGPYRLWAEADAAGWFEDADRANNVTWVDLELFTLPGPVRAAEIIDVGPQPG